MPSKKTGVATPYDVQTVAQAAARAALSEFADSAARRDELEAIMTKTVHATLAPLGIDVTSAESVERFRKNMEHLESWREFTELVKAKGVGAAVSYITKGILLILTLGVVALFGRHLSGN